MASLPQRHTIPVRNGLLAALPPEDLDRLRPHLHPVELTFDATLTRAGDVVDAVLFPESGMISLLATPGGTESVEVGIAGREGMIGLPLVFGDDRALVEARVQQDGTALRLEAAALRDMLTESAALQAVLLRYAMAFNTQVSLTAACNTFHVVEQRFARWLLAAHDRAEGDDFPMTHDFLSAMLGVRRPGVSVAAAVLQKAGLIRYARGRMEITDRPGLEAAACECYQTARREFACLLGASRAVTLG